MKYEKSKSRETVLLQLLRAIATASDVITEEIVQHPTTKLIAGKSRDILLLHPGLTNLSHELQ